MEPTWEELLGSNQWKGLLEPLNPNLRKLILQCGEFCQSNRDTFVGDQNSKYYGKSRYFKKSFFENVQLQFTSDHYFVDTFLYATVIVENQNPETNWAGYIAVTSDDQVSKNSGRREIYVTWRSTTTDLEWKKDAESELASMKQVLNPIDINDDSLKVMKGWFSIYTSGNPKSTIAIPSARTQLRAKIEELVNRYKEDNLSLIFTGHSLGGCLSTLSAFDMVENGLSHIPVTAFIFSSPKVGNKAFNDKLASFPNLRILHTKNVIDLVPGYPIQVAYVPTGLEFFVDSRKSPYLKDSTKPEDWHNLEALLHIIAGWNGKDGEFQFKVERSVGLVNKETDFLKKECMIPKSWLVEKNKGMVIDEDGKWIEAPASKEDFPVPEF